MKIKFLMALVLVAGLQFSTNASAQPRPGQGRAGARPMREAWSQLSPDEKAKLRGARQSALSDPSVQASRERMREARRQFHDSMRSAMMKADPTVQPILEKLPKRQERGHQ